MAAPGKWYGKALLSAYAKETNYLTDAIKGMLTTNTYVPDQDVHDYKDDVTNEVTGTNYTAGGATLANKTLTYTGATNVTKFDADDLTWATSTIANARICVIYNSAPATDATRPLLWYIVNDADVSTTAGLLTVAFDAAGIATATAS